MTNQRMKTKFRRSARWTRFRKAIKKEQRIDPITGSPLTPKANLHHLDLDEQHYTDISDRSRFIMLNKTSHELVHFVYSSHDGWQHALAALADICSRMDDLNGKPALPQSCG